MMNFIDESTIDKNVCDIFIDFFEKNKDKHQNGEVFSKGISKVDKNIKSTREIGYDDIPNKLKNLYLVELKKSIEKYIDEYEEVNDLPYFTVESFHIQKYKRNEGFLQWHFERGISTNTYYRCLVFMTYLNDVISGGETEFKYQNISFKPEKGKTLIWPSDWTHTHRGNKVRSKDKYIITGWFVNSLSN